MACFLVFFLITVILNRPSVLNLPVVLIQMHKYILSSWLLQRQLVCGHRQDICILLDLIFSNKDLPHYRLFPAQISLCGKQRTVSQGEKSEPIWHQWFSFSGYSEERVEYRQFPPADLFYFFSNACYKIGVSPNPMPFS